jgi:hypothetical protein
MCLLLVVAEVAELVQPTRQAQLRPKVRVEEAALEALRSTSKILTFHTCAGITKQYQLLLVRVGLVQRGLTEAAPVALVLLDRLEQRHLLVFLLQQAVLEDLVVHRLMLLKL